MADRHRDALIAAVHAVLARLEGGSGPAPARDPGTEPAALDLLCASFDLTGFERDVLVLAAAMELDATAGARCAKAGGDPLRPYPTFGLALAAFADPHWSALTPVAPLRRWRLVELADDGAVTTARLRIDERVLHFLAGVPYVDVRLHGLVTRVEPAGSAPAHARGEPGGELPAPYARVAEAIATAWHGADGPPHAELAGADPWARAEVTGAVVRAAGLSLYTVRAEDLPGEPAEREALARLWEREALLLPAALLVEADGADRSRVTAADAFAAALTVPVVLSSTDPLPADRRRRPRFALPELDADEQRRLWARALNGPDGDLPRRLAAQFSLPAHVIRAVGTAAPRDAEPDAAWRAALTEARVGLDELGRRIEPRASWHNLVLPAAQRSTVDEIVAHVRQRGVVYHEWGFESVLRNGLGVTALFAGGSGTGKTLAAEVMADELGLDLFVVDLSQVISKYIGETEKNLRRVFDAAERGGALLLFDEADALFGKRSEIKDSHDRYANIEVSYLLMRMEAYRGLAILTTNMKKALDSAFLRRIRFVVDFPFPGVAERAEIWRRVIPPGVPVDGLDFGRLAQLTVAGGSIRNVALSAAFLAAEEGTSVGMRHALAAARTEYQKLERSLTPAEVAGWV